jgi:hypothetical protein
VNAKTDIFVQKNVCRLFALNTMLAGHYACVNAMSSKGGGIARRRRGDVEEKSEKSFVPP